MKQAVSPMQKLPLSLCLVLYTLLAQAQRPVFRILQEPKLHAGCYIGTDQQVLANLSEDDDHQKPAAIFNLTGKDEIFEAIPGTKQYPMAFRKGKYTIFIKDRFIKKVPDSCLENHRFDLLLKIGTKQYTYRFKGFCGC